MSERRLDDQKVIITVKFTNIIEAGDNANIQVFNLFLHNCLRNLELKQIGRYFYDPKTTVRFYFNKYLLFTYYLYGFYILLD